MSQKPLKLTGWVRDFLRTLWIPTTWSLLVVVHIILFASGVENKNILIIIFDKFIMFSCFLLYPISMIASGSTFLKLLPFAVQFLFWWVFAFAVVRVYTMRRQRAPKS